jgi:hypothetical protein
LLSRLGFSPPPRVLALGIVNTSWRRDLAVEEVPPAVQAALDE